MYEMGITAGMQSQTTGIRNLDWKQYIKVALPKPSPDEQTAIAAILSKVDEAIAAVQGSIAAAERLKKSLMQNLLSGRMKPDGTLRKEDEFYVDEKFGKVPIGWKVKKLKDVCLNSGDYGANASAIAFDETKPRFIRITDIDDFGQLLDDGKASMDGDNTTKYMLEEDDFLFARTGDTVGKSLLYKKEMGPAVYAGYLIKFTFDKTKVLPEYFDLIAKSEFFEAFKIAMKRVGAKPNINSREYCSFRFLLPSDIEEQKRIFNKFASVAKSQRKKQNKIIILERLKKSLMQNLLTGVVRIK
jgi:type I restriction enzyme S subunit